MGEYRLLLLLVICQLLNKILDFEILLQTKPYGAANVSIVISMAFVKHCINVHGPRFYLTLQAQVRSQLGNWAPAQSSTSPSGAADSINDTTTTMWKIMYANPARYKTYHAECNEA